MTPKATATLDGKTAVEVLHTQTVVSDGGVVTRYFVRFPAQGTGWVDEHRLTDITQAEETP